MKGKLLLVAGVAAGYVWGARAGRERYEQIKRTANHIKENPRVQETAQQAADLAKAKAPLVGDALTDAARATAERVRATTDGGLNGTATP